MPIVFEKVSYEYSVGTPFSKVALRDVSLKIAEGESLCVLGATGSGKTTFALLTNGVLLPTKGSVFVDGLDTADKRVDIKEVRRRVGVVLQYPEHQFFLPTVEEEILYAPKNFLAAEQKELERSLEEALELLEIKKELLHRNPFELSGGEKRRVAIASILSYNPKYLVMDEPLVGLDSKVRSQLLRFLKALKEMGKTWIVISHDVDEFLFMADRFLVFHDGSLAFDGKREEFVLKAFDHLKEWGLYPSTKLRFLAALPKEIASFITDDEKLESAIVSSGLMDCEEVRNDRSFPLDGSRRF